MLMIEDTVHVNYFRFYLSAWLFARQQNAKMWRIERNTFDITSSEQWRLRYTK